MNANELAQMEVGRLVFRVIELQVELEAAQARVAELEAVIAAPEGVEPTDE